MRKLTTILFTLFISVKLFSQVGINTDNPNASLEIASLPSSNTIVDGFIPPKLTGDEVKAKSTLYGTNQNGTIIYITRAVTTPVDKTINILSPGYYYYDSNLSQWLPMIIDGKNGITKNKNTFELGGTLNKETVINGVNGTNKLKIESLTGINAINLGNNNISIDATNKRVGINNIAPASSLDVVGNVKISELQENNLATDKVVTVNTTGVLKKVDSKIFYNEIDQTINFSSTTNATFTATGNEDVIWLAGGNTSLTLAQPTDAQVRRGRIIHIIAAGGDVSFPSSSYKPLVTNGYVLTKLVVGNRISIVPVNVFGGKAWYTVSASQVYTSSSAEVSPQ